MSGWSGRRASADGDALGGHVEGFVFQREPSADTSERPDAVTCRWLSPIDLPRAPVALVEADHRYAPARGSGERHAVVERRVYPTIRNPAVAK
jgi:hypothetical protein